MSGTAARVITAMVLIPLVVWLVLWGPTWLVAIVVAGIILLALHEFFALGAKLNMPGYRRFTMLCALGILWAMTCQAESEQLDVARTHFEQMVALPEFYLAVFVVGAAVLTLTSKRTISEALPSCAVSAAGMLFIAWPLSYLVRLYFEMPPRLLFVLVLVWAGDTSAFFVGRLIGKHSLAPLISPKKTLEGALANLLGSLVAGLAFYKWQHDLGFSSTAWWQNEHLSRDTCLNLALLVSVTGQMGDLLESAWKRSAGVKDSGALLPGHGGILDRIDALLLAAPAVWWYFRFLAE